MATTVMAGALFTAGLRSEFAGNYSKAKREGDARVADLMDLDIPSDKLTEYFAYTLSAPHMGRWEKGKDIGNKPFGSVGFNVTNKTYGKRVSWHREDREDDQTKTLVSAAQACGRSAGLLDERTLIQIETAASDPNLLLAIPNAPDGAPLHSATDGAGNARFGATNGNLLTGTGVATSQAVYNDFWSAMEQAEFFQDTEGQPLFDGSVIEGGVVVLYSSRNRKIFEEAFKRERDVVVITNAILGGTENVAAATPDNLLAKRGQIVLWPTPRKTDNDWSIWFKGCWVKPIFSMAREGIKEESATMDTSDYSKDTGIEFQQWHLRRGYGVNLPFGTIKINN